MAKITIHDEIPYRFGGGEYTLDTSRQFEGYQPNDLICFCCPFFDIPLRLEIAIRDDGSLAFRGWDWSGRGNSYLHTAKIPAPGTAVNPGFAPSAAQVDTVAGLFSGRIRFEGLRLAPGKTLQAICPIDLAAEEARCGKTIYRA